MSVTFLNDQSFEFDKYEGQILVFLSAELDSTFAKKQIQDSSKDNYIEKMQDLGANCFLVTKEPGPSDFENYLLDADNQIAKMFEPTKKLKSWQIFTKVVSGQLQYLIHRDAPETEYNWVENSLQFVINYQDSTPDPSNNYYRWGQIVQEDGDYLCVDCGYIIDFKKGQLFPVCEVCLDGDPTAPDAGPEAGYWEKV